MTDLQIGDALASKTVTLTRADAVRYAGASGDFNPIHWSDRQAGELGLDSVIVHGMWTMGAAFTVITDWLAQQGDATQGGTEPQERLKSYSVRFTAPIAIPDTDEGVEVKFGATVTAITDDAITFALSATVGDTKVLGAAKAEVSR